MIKKIKELFSKYEGSVDFGQNDDGTEFVSIQAKNKISEVDFNSHPILCCIDVIKSANEDEITPYHLNYYEKSFCVLGGGGGHYAEYEILEAVKKELKRYQFRKRVV